MTDPKTAGRDAGDRLEAHLAAAGAEPAKIVDEGHTSLFLFGEPRQEPDRAGQPVALLDSDGTWSDTSGDGHAYRSVTGVVSFNGRPQVWVAREDTWRRCHAEGRLPSTDGISSEAAPWPAEQTAVIGEPEPIDDGGAPPS